MSPRPCAPGRHASRDGHSARSGHSAWRHHIDEWFGPPEATPCNAYTARPQWRCTLGSVEVAVPGCRAAARRLGAATCASRSRRDVSRSVERDAQPRKPATSASPWRCPGCRNVHSHGFQRGMAGLTEYRGPEADNFWSWRELMYRFVARMTPDDLEAVTAQAYVEMLEGGFTRVGEFHYVHHDPTGMPYANPAETGGARGGGGRGHRHRLTLLPVFYAHGNFGGAPPNDRAAALRHRRRRIRPVVRGQRGGSLRAARCIARRGAAQPARRDARELAHSGGAAPRRARCTSMPPNRPAKWRNASPGRARDRCNGCSIMRRWIRAGAWCTPRT